MTAAYVYYVHIPQAKVECFRMTPVFAYAWFSLFSLKNTSDWFGQLEFLINNEWGEIFIFYRAQQKWQLQNSCFILPYRKETFKFGFDVTSDVSSHNEMSCSSLICPL